MCMHTHAYACTANANVNILQRQIRVQGLRQWPVGDDIGADAPLPSFPSLSLLSTITYRVTGMFLSTSI